MWKKCLLLFSFSSLTLVSEGYKKSEGIIPMALALSLVLSFSLIFEALGGGASSSIYASFSNSSILPSSSFINSLLGSIRGICIHQRKVLTPIFFQSQVHKYLFFQMQVLRPLFFFHMQVLISFSFIYKFLLLFLPSYASSYFSFSFHI